MNRFVEIPCQYLFLFENVPFQVKCELMVRNSTQTWPQYQFDRSFLKIIAWISEKLDKNHFLVKVIFLLNRLFWNEFKINFFHLWWKQTLFELIIIFLFIRRNWKNWIKNTVCYRNYNFGSIFEQWANDFTFIFESSVTKHFYATFDFQDILDYCFFIGIISKSFENKSNNNYLVFLSIISLVYHQNCFNWIFEQNRCRNSLFNLF